MMNIVIVGGGELGRHVAAILSKEKHNIVLIDKDPKVIQSISSNMDVATRVGLGTDWELLEDLLEFSPNLFIALTGDDEANLVACSLAKQLQYPRTVCRIRNNIYLNSSRLDFSRIFDVDYFISPELLSAHDIVKNIINPEAIFVEHFAHGALQLRTILIPKTWRAPRDTSLRNLDLPQNVIVSLIRRDTTVKDIPTKKVIFPHGDDEILPGDEVTFIGESSVISGIHRYFGINEKEIKSIVIAGGSLTAINVAKLLEDRTIDVTIIEKDYDKCCYLADRLPHCTIIQHDATDLEFLRSEKIGQTDLLIGCTQHDEINLLVASLGKEIGCEDVLVMLNNIHYMPMAQRLGAKNTVAPHITATNHILSQLFAGKVTSLISLYENQAEIIEISVSLSSRVVGIPLSELGPYLPRDLLIVMIQNRGRIMIANGNRIISPGDTVIVVTSPQHVDDLSRIF